MIDDICSESKILCWAVQHSPTIIFYLFVGIFALKGFIGFLADTIPQIETLKAKVYLPLARKHVFRKLSKQASKADIKGAVNSAVLKFAPELPLGWLKPMDIEWVITQSREDFLKDDEVIIRIRPVEDQKLNFITAVYYFLRKSFFPKTKKVIPDSHFEASVLFTSRKIIENQKPELVSMFEEQILEVEIDRDSKILNALENYKIIDRQGLFTTFLREVHAVASDAKLTPMRNKMRQETNEILNHIKDFLNHYNEGAKQNKWANSIPAEMWTRVGPITNYGFLLIAMPFKVSAGTAAYVNKAEERALSGVDRLYVFGAESEKIFANKVIEDISSGVSKYKLLEKFSLSHDYRGTDGGIGALFVKRSTKTLRTETSRLASSP